MAKKTAEEAGATPDVVAPEPAPEPVPPTSEEFRMAATPTRLPSSASPQGYVPFEWEGTVAYQCEGCGYSSTEESEVRDHVAFRHPPDALIELPEDTIPAPTLLPQGGTIRAVFDAEGNFVGFEEVPNA